MKYQLIHLKDYFEFLGKDNADPTVELYLPYNMTEMNRENSKRPCMIVCPGGAYAMCSQRESEPIALNFLPEGFNVFVITYSCDPYRFPTQMLEVAALMELIYQNSENWNCDTSKITICGFSAGAHLAAHYSTMFNCKEVRNVFPQSKSVNASILCYPVITADEKYSHADSIRSLIGHKPADDEEQDYFSCEKQVDANTPPAFIWHTAADDCVPVMNSLLYAAALANNNVPFELQIFPFGPHGLSTSDNQTCDDVKSAQIYAHKWLDEVKKWLEIMNMK